MNSFRLNRKETISHSFIWGGIIVFIHFLDSGYETNFIFNSISTLIFVLLSYAIPYYFFALIIFPKYWHVNIIKLGFWITISFAYYWTIYLGEVLYIIPLVSKEVPFQGISIWGLFMDAVFLFSINLGFAFTFFIKKKQTQDLINQLNNERSLILKDFIFLKNQLNSHTTYNFLNYCYSLVQDKSINAAKSIELFSDMLRYTSSIKSEQKVDLETELTYIKNYIELKALLSSSMHVEFLCNGILTNHKIIPRILITYIENAFKHGVTNNPLQPVIIKLEISKNILKLYVKNLVKKKKEYIQNSGTGIKNASNLLELIYSNRFNLNIDTNNEIYEVNLELNLY